MVMHTNQMYTLIHQNCFQNIMCVYVCTPVIMVIGQLLELMNFIQYHSLNVTSRYAK